MLLISNSTVDVVVSMNFKGSLAPLLRNRLQYVLQKGLVEGNSSSSKLSKNTKLSVHVSSACSYIYYACNHSVLHRADRAEVLMLPESCKDGADVSLVYFHRGRMARAWSLQSDRVLVGCFKSVESAKIFNQRSTTVDLTSIDRYNSPLAGVERPREMDGEEFSERRIYKCNS